MTTATQTLKLAIITSEGVVVLVADDLREYDLNKPLNQADLIERLRDQIATLERDAAK